MCVCSSPLAADDLENFTTVTDEAANSADTSTPAVTGDTLTTTEDPAATSDGQTGKNLFSSDALAFYFCSDVDFIAVLKLKTLFLNQTFDFWIIFGSFLYFHEFTILVAEEEEAGNCVAMAATGADSSGTRSRNMSLM